MNNTTVGGGSSQITLSYLIGMNKTQMIEYEGSVGSVGRVLRTRVKPAPETNYFLFRHPVK
jgi:hypothetical protein